MCSSKTTYNLHQNCLCTVHHRACAQIQHAHANAITIIIRHVREHMQTQTRTLPLEHSRSNLIPSCASKSDISGWIVCSYVQCPHTSFVVTVQIRVRIEVCDMCQAEDRDISVGFTWKMSRNSRGARLQIFP